MLFQSIIIDKYIKNLSLDAVQSAYANFTAHFHNPIIQDNIRTSKEEQYQEGFLRDLFVQIFGYMLNPADNYNLTTEFKNLKGAKKCDGAILKSVNGEEKALAVIELKGMDTTDLSRIEAQAFGYKNNHPTARYVITSNFQKLRFYIDNAVEYLEFDLFKLDFEAFKLLYLLLQAENLLNDLPLKLKSESISQEEKITHALYQDYSAFKRALFADLCAKNSQYNALELFAKTQKLLDRLLFIFFAEDSGLLSANTAHTMLIEWQKLKDLKMPISVYDQLKRYFGFLNTGYKDEHSEIFAYNGGLFKPDEILDSLIISDDILSKHIKKIADYNFASEIDVNILGHIFENSLNEIDEIKAELNGEKIDKKSTKRKKDGVFYTPKYITSYIIQNTIGKLCDDKKRELNLNDEDYITDKKRQKKTQETLLQKLKDYRAWLLDLTICDPACGSGAFLNESLNFLISEHAYLDELESKLFGGGLVFQEVRNHILEHNLFGVDINAESVEIAKLSLWLRTAEPHRKLSNLNQNIKCGNSLIDDVDVAGDKAFDWEKEFPQVFAKGGFDVVVGNPPYFNVQTLGAKSLITEYLQKEYSNIWQDKSDILFYFIEKAIKISKNKIGFIISNAFLFSDKAQKLRNRIIADNRLSKIVNFEKYMIFTDASITSCILLFENEKQKTKAILMKEKNYEIDDVVNFINDENNAFEVSLENDKVFALVDDKIAKLNAKIDGNHRRLQDVIMIGKGMETACNSVFSFDYMPNQFPQEFIKKQIIGENIRPYYLNPTENYLLYFENVENFDDLPTPIQEHLLNNQEVLKNRATVKNEGRIWHKFSRPMHKENYHLNKIWCSYRSSKNAFILDESSDYIGLTNTTVIFDTNENIALKYLLAILNSKLFFFRYQSIGKQTGNGVFEFFANGIGKFPIKEISLTEQTPFIILADQMLSLNQALQDVQHKFLRTLERRLALSEPSKQLQNWQNLSYGEFIKELAKKKIKLKLADEADWEDYFTTEQSKATDLQTKIRAVDDEINAMVYGLYGLTEDEVKIIES